MHVLGYFAALLIGLLLGMIGGGGSILTVPVLVYLFNIAPVAATSYSLVIVGITSGIGAIQGVINNTANLKMGIQFGCASLLMVFLVRKFLMPSIPEHLFAVDDIVVTRSFLMMLLFSVLMTIAGLRMLRKKPVAPGQLRSKIELPRILLASCLVGLVAGVLGIGAGFLIVPALVLFFNVPMKEAAGTSVVVISLNSLAGVLADAGHVSYNWRLLLLITVIAVAGLFIGSLLKNRLDSSSLKTMFGWLVLTIAIIIFCREWLGLIPG